MGAPGSSATIRFPASLIDSDVRNYLKEYGVKFKEDDPREQDHELEIENVLGDLEAEIEEGIFRLYDGEARYGEFEGLEPMLKEKGIPFDRQSRMDWDRPPTLRVFRPVGDRPCGGETDLYIPLDPDTDEPVVSVAAIREIVDAYAEEECRGQLYGALSYYLLVHFPTYPPLSDWVKKEGHAPGS